MEPITTALVDVHYRGDGGQIGDLPTHKGDKSTTSWWMPTDEDREVIKNGGAVAVRHLGNIVVPLSVYATPLASYADVKRDNPEFAGIKESEYPVPLNFISDEKDGRFWADAKLMASLCDHVTEPTGEGAWWLVETDIEDDKVTRFKLCLVSESESDEGLLIRLEGFPKNQPVPLTDYINELRGLNLSSGKASNFIRAYVPEQILSFLFPPVTAQPAEGECGCEVCAFGRKQSEVCALLDTMNLELLDELDWSDKARKEVMINQTLVVACVAFLATIHSQRSLVNRWLWFVQTMRLINVPYRIILDAAVKLTMSLILLRWSKSFQQKFDEDGEGLIHTAIASCIECEGEKRTSRIGSFFDIVVNPVVFILALVILSASALSALGIADYQASTTGFWASAIAAIWMVYDVLVFKPKGVEESMRIAHFAASKGIFFVCKTNEAKGDEPR